MTRNTKHTPGPWTATSGPGGLLYTTDQDGRDLASITTLDDGINNDTRRMEARANAKLIASAPELLGALSVLVDHAEERYPHFESTRGQTDLAQARAAIAKAEGAKK